MLSQWANCGSSQQEKREFYYNIFLLDPTVAKKEVHKQSLQKVTSLNKAIEGWMTLEGFQASLDKASEAEVEKALQDVLDAKQECDRQKENLSKEFAPHKLWAKNKELLK